MSPACQSDLQGLERVIDGIDRYGAGLAAR